MTQIKEMLQGTLRQRRNLIVMSMIIAFVLYSHVTIKSVNLFGISLDVPNSKAVFVVMWLIWANFLMRFIQYALNDTAFQLTYYYKFAILDVGQPMLKRYVLNNVENVKSVGHIHPDEITENSNGEWTLRPLVDLNDDKETSKGIELILPPKFIYWMRTQALLKTIFLTPVVTDFILPFIIALATLIYGLYVYFK